MNAKGILRISSVEKGESGNLVICGVVVNESRAAVSIPWLGDPRGEDGLVMTSLGFLEVKEQRGWARITKFKDGIRPLVALQPGELVKFCFPTLVALPKEERRYRLTMPNMAPVEFIF